MKRLLMAGAFLAGGAGSAMADCPGIYPGGLQLFGAYTTTAPTGALVNTSSQPASLLETDGQGRDVGIGGNASGGTLGVCLTSDANTAWRIAISVQDTNPVSGGGSFLSEFAFTLDGVPVGGVTYASDSQTVTATLELVLPSDVMHALGIVNVVQQHNGGSYTTGGHSYPVTGYASDQINVDMEFLDQVPLPEPGSLALLGAGLAAFGALRRRRVRAA